MSCFACAAWIAMNCVSCFEVGWAAFCIFFALYWFPLFAKSHAQVWFCRDTDGACTFCACLVCFFLMQGVAAWARTSLVVHVLFCLCCVNCHELSILFWGRIELPFCWAAFCIFLCIFFALYWFPLFAQSHAQVWYCQDTDGACTFCACLIWLVLPFFRCREWHFGQELVLWFMSCFACAAWIAMNWPSCFEVGWAAFLYCSLYFLCVILISIVCKVLCPGMVLSRHGWCMHVLCLFDLACSAFF